MADSTEPPRFVASSDLARAFGVDARTIARWHARGGLPGSVQIEGAKRLRWPVAVAVELVRKAGAEVPREWMATAKKAA